MSFADLERGSDGINFPTKLKRRARTKPQGEKNKVSSRPGWIIPKRNFGETKESWKEKFAGEWGRTYDSRKGIDFGLSEVLRHQRNETKKKENSGRTYR